LGIKTVAEIFYRRLISIYLQLRISSGEAIEIIIKGLQTFSWVHTRYSGIVN